MNLGDISARMSRSAAAAFEAAFEAARRRGAARIEIAHLLEQIVKAEGGDAAAAIRFFRLDRRRLETEIARELDLIRGGSDRVAGVTEDAERLLLEAAALADRTARGAGPEAPIRTGHLLLASVEDQDFRRAALHASREFAKIDAGALRRDFEEILLGSVEAGAAPAAAKAPAPAGALARYAVDLTKRAAEGGFDAITGRDAEIRQMIDILMRRRQNNPILVGEAGVGKTAVVEGFAQRIAAGDAPPALIGVPVLALDLGLLQAGASMKGEFEARLRAVIDEAKAAPVPPILFIDEAHTLIGAGGAAGTGDAANLIKPALARGELRTIAATTWAEYKRHIEPDPALTRRFEPVRIEEPSAEAALGMLRGVAAALEAHHGVTALDEALEAAVRLSDRYVPARQLPDKAVALLDTACARVAVGLHATPAAVEAARRRIAALETAAAITAREAAIGLGDPARGPALAAEIEGARAALSAIEARWAAERAAVAEILALRAGLADGIAAGIADGLADGGGEDRPARLAALAEKTAALAAMQGEAPLLRPAVDAESVAAVVESWTGVPVARMSADSAEALLALPATLARRVVGQDHAMEAIARRVLTSRAGLTAPEKPVGVFLLAGPSGVGKTETALALAEALHGDEGNIVTINMSEFQEAHSVSTLKGAPPGYVGYGEGGVLTEAVRRRPYAVVLLDEIEKAHPDVHEIFFQVFDKGWMEDGEGRRIDFRNTIILLTSNVGSDLVMKLCADPELAPAPEALAEALRPALLGVFPAALLGRVVTIPYLPLSAATLDAIAALKLEAVARRLKAAHGTELRFGPDALALIRARATEIESGGRMIDAILTNTLLPGISRELLSRLGRGAPPARVTVTADGAGFAFAFEG